MSDEVIIGPNSCATCGGEYGEHAEGCSSLAAPAGSATFVIKREAYPENFKGFNEYGYTIWTSYEPDGLRVTGEQINTTMERIKATAYSNAVKLSAHLLPNADFRRGEPDAKQQSVGESPSPARNG